MVHAWTGSQSSHGGAGTTWSGMPPAQTRLLLPTYKVRPAQQEHCSSGAALVENKKKDKYGCDDSAHSLPTEKRLLKIVCLTKYKCVTKHTECVLKLASMHAMVPIQNGVNVIEQELAGATGMLHTFPHGDRVRGICQKPIPLSSSFTYAIGVMQSHD